MFDNYEKIVKSIKENLPETEVVLLSLTLIANGYLRIIKAIYFTSSPNIFDRADRGIYVFLFVNLIIVIVALLHPRLLMNDFEKMLITVF